MEDNDFTPSHPVQKPSTPDDGIRYFIVLINIPNILYYYICGRSRLRKRKDDDEKKEDKREMDVRIKQELPDRDIKSIVENITDNIDTVTISDEEDGKLFGRNILNTFLILLLIEGREVLSFNPKASTDIDERTSKYASVRELFGGEEKDNIYIMDAKNAGNIGRFLNVSYMF